MIKSIAAPWRATRFRFGLALLAMIVAGPGWADEAGRELFADDFSGDLAAWTISDPATLRVVESGDEAHGGVLLMSPAQSPHYALIAGSEAWPAYRIEGEVLFPEDEHNYLGFIYNLVETNGRFDLGSVYIKGNGSYIRVNPRRDWNPARMLYEEFRVPLTGDAAIEIGRWQRFALEVDGPVCHLYVGDMATPQLTFPYFEGSVGRAGFKPRVVGGAVWIDNVRAVAIDGLSYKGPMLPRGLDHEPGRMVRDWQVIGPFTGTRSEIERAPVVVDRVLVEGKEHLWRPFETDPRGAVVTARVVDFIGDRTVAYFRATIEVPAGGSAELQFSSIDDLTMWLNGQFEGYSYADRFAWHDFGVNPDHPPSRYTGLPLVEGTNHVLIRVRGGRYASGGFFAAVRWSD